MDGRIVEYEVDYVWKDNLDYDMDYRIMDYGWKDKGL